MFTEAKKGTPPYLGFFQIKLPSDVLLFRHVSMTVPSTQEGLTSVFGMGTGVSPPLLPPEQTGKLQAPQKGLAVGFRRKISYLEGGLSEKIRIDQASRPISTG